MCKVELRRVCSANFRLLDWGALVESRDTHRSYASSLLAEASGSVGAGKEPKNSTPHFVGSIRERSIDSLALPLVRQVNCFAKVIAKRLGWQNCQRVLHNTSLLCHLLKIKLLQAHPLSIYTFYILPLRSTLRLSFPLRLIAAKAATKIQAVFRGHKVRETMKKSETKTATNNGASNAVAANAASAAAAAAAEVEPTKAELEAEFDPNDKGK